MKHPLVGKTVYFYLVAWGVVMIMHAAILSWLYYFPIGIAVGDAILFNTLMAGVGLSYWYVVQYIKPSNQKVRSIVLTHLAGVFITVSLVAYSTVAILSFLYSEEKVFVQFLNSTFLWRIIIGAGFLSLIIMIYYLLQYNYNLKQKEQEELELQNMLRHSELEMLKFQVNPHFIFNSLNSISSLTHTDPSKARAMVIRLSDFMRVSLRDNPDQHTLREELDQMNLYLEIEKVRFGERLLTNFDIEEPCFDMILPNMILQPLYENSIKYGVYDQLGIVEVKTTCTCAEESLQISVTNNYDSESLPRKGRGIGLKNVQNRLELIYGMRGLVTIEKNRTSFTVHLLIPQRQKI